jgi:hypothetical protein
MTQFLIGISGALVGVVGWLMVGLFIQARAHDRQGRDAGRAVFFELNANRLSVFIAHEYGVFGQVSSSAYERLLPEVSTWLPAAELQALVIAYLGHGGYEQASKQDEDVPEAVRKQALGALLEAHDVAVGLLRQRVFSAHELATLNRYVSDEYAQMLEAADAPIPRGGRR